MFRPPVRSPRGAVYWAPAIWACGGVPEVRVPSLTRGARPSACSGALPPNSCLATRTTNNEGAYRSVRPLLCA